MSGLCVGQALVATTPLELKKPWDRRQILASSSPDGTFYSFASDRQKVVCLKYNSALFLRDSLKAPSPDKDAVMSGTSVGDNGNTYLYWTSTDFSKVYVTAFDFKTRATSQNSFRFSFDNETFLGTYNDAGAFHFLTVDDEKPQLKIRTFKNGNPEERTVDFSPFEITDRKGKKLKFVDAFLNMGFQFIQENDFVPLSQSAAKIKIYPKNGNLSITFDHDPSFTQLFSIDGLTLSVAQKKIPHPDLETHAVSQANSFLVDSVLYQIRISSKELVVASKNPDALSGVQRRYGVTIDENIGFRTSPLLVQNGNKKPFELSSTKKFLSRLETAQPAISAYPGPQGIILNCGGVREIQDTGNIILGATLGVGAIAGGGSYDIGSMLGPGIIQSIYFESLFDDDFNFTKKDMDPLSIDFLSGFMYENQNIQTYFLTSLGKAKILAYYDAKQKAVVLRKFEDAPSIGEFFER